MAGLHEKICLARVVFPAKPNFSERSQPSIRKTKIQTGPNFRKVWLETQKPSRLLQAQWQTNLFGTVFATNISSLRNKFQVAFKVPSPPKPWRLKFSRRPRVTAPRIRGRGSLPGLALNRGQDVTSPTDRHGICTRVVRTILLKFLRTVQKIEPFVIRLDTVVSHPET